MGDYQICRIQMRLYEQHTEFNRGRKGGYMTSPSRHRGISREEKNKDGNHEAVIPSGPLGFTFVGNKVTHVFENSYADKEGVKVGWKIVGVNGEKLSGGEFAITKAIQKSNTNNLPTNITFSS